MYAICQSTLLDTVKYTHESRFVELVGVSLPKFCSIFSSGIMQKQ